MLPKAQYLPARSGQRRVGTTIARNVAFQLRTPVVNVPGRYRGVQRAEVPEASIDEDRHPTAGEHDVGSRLAIGESDEKISSVAQPASEQFAAQPDLRSRVTPTIGLHVRAPGILGHEATLRLMNDGGQVFELDSEVNDVIAALEATRDRTARFARVFRSTYDQLYDGQHTGRYSWEQLYKTEKTHFGTLLEINLRREFTDLIGDGRKLDYTIAGHDVDCKYSFRMGGWMLPPESFGEIVLVATSSDEKSEWAVGVVRVTPEVTRASTNRDGKTGLSESGRRSIHWVDWAEELAPNVLLDADEETRQRIFAPKSGQARVNELLRSLTRKRIGRNTIATVAQQDDYMKRVRGNGGARTALAPEGILVIGGDYSAHQRVAESLGCVVPQPGEVVSVQVVPARGDEPNIAEIAGALYRAAEPGDLVYPAPELPSVKRES